MGGGGNRCSLRKESGRGGKGHPAAEGSRCECWTPTGSHVGVGQDWFCSGDARLVPAAAAATAPQSRGRCDARVVGGVGGGRALASPSHSRAAAPRDSHAAALLSLPPALSLSTPPPHNTHTSFFHAFLLSSAPPSGPPEPSLGRGERERERPVSEP